MANRQQVARAGLKHKRRLLDRGESDTNRGARYSKIPLASQWLWPITKLLEATGSTITAPTVCCRNSARASPDHVWTWPVPPDATILGSGDSGRKGRKTRPESRNVE